MRHHNIAGGRHYGVGTNTIGGVLLQLGEDTTESPYHVQIRAVLTLAETDDLIAGLQAAKKKAEDYLAVTGDSDGR